MRDTLQGGGARARRAAPHKHTVSVPTETYLNLSQRISRSGSLSQCINPFTGLCIKQNIPIGAALRHLVPRAPKALERISHGVAELLAHAQLLLALAPAAATLSVAALHVVATVHRSMGLATLPWPRLKMTRGAVAEPMAEAAVVEIHESR